MDDSRYRAFFVQPTDPRQRQYEALHAFFVDQRPMADIAQQFGYRHDTVRRLVSHFRRDYDANRLPPFSPRLRKDDRQLRRARRRRPRSNRSSRTYAPWT